MRELLRRAWVLIHRRRFEADLSEEIEFHRHMTQHRLEEAGVEADEAAFAARRALGNTLAAREHARDVWIPPWLQNVTQDLRFAARIAARDRRLTLAAVVALALGIGANTIVFTIVNAMTLRGLPVDDPDRIVGFSQPGGGPLSASYRDIEDWRAAATSLAGIAAYSDSSPIVGDEGRSPEVYPGVYISANAFRLLGERPILGRDFVAGDDRPGAPAVVILGYAVWSTRYGSDPSIVGRTIRVNNVPSVVIGVMAEGFRFPLVHDLWQPLALAPGLVTERRDARSLRVFGRLADGVTVADAQAELNVVTGRLASAFPATNRDLRPVITPYTGSANQPIFVALFGAVAFMLLIACANVANLLLARAAGRSREIAIRVSLGAGRWRLVRQLLVESLLLALLAGLAGYSLAVAGVKLFAVNVEGINFAYWYDDRWTMDWRVFAFIAGIALGTAFVFGLIPALHLSNTDANESLKDGARASGAAVGRWMSGLLVAELAFTLILLTAAGLMMRSFIAVYRSDAIVDPSRVLTISVRVPARKYPTPAERAALFERVEERLAAIPSIASVAIANAVPFIGSATRQIAIDGRAIGAADTPPTVSHVLVGDRYFETLELRLVRGRRFSPIDGTPGHEAAIVNQRLVSMLFPNENPLGRRIRLMDPNAREEAGPWLTIVGVSPTVRQQFFRDIDAVVYVPYRTNPGLGPMFLIRGGTEPAALTRTIREQVHAIDADLAAFRAVPLEVWMKQSRWGHRVFGTMFAVFAVVALVVSAVGLYAITAYSVTKRTHEIGVRMALGAQATQVAWLFVRRAVAPLGVGLALGLCGAFGVGRGMRGFLFQTSASDPLTLVAIAVLLIVIAAAACLLPMRRATRLDPVAALRYE
jgi:predicted permease